MIDIQTLKEQIDENKIIQLMDSFGVEVAQQNEKCLIFYSVCHHPNDFNEHKPKLYYYIDTRSFYCFVCGFSGDIFELIKQIRQCNLRDCIDYIVSICGIQIKEIDKNNKQVQIDEWQCIKKYLPNESFEETIPTYDKSVLNLFSKLYTQSWINDGISIQAMQKFQIGWYGKNRQITIPVFNVDGNLVGIHGRNTNQYLVSKGLKYQPVKTLSEEYKFPTGKILYGLYENQKNIADTKEVVLVEAPKSVLQAETILPINNCVALFGWNCQKYRRDLLLKYNINHVIIGIDKQFEQIGTDEYLTYVKQVKKIIKLFRAYCKVSVLFDANNILSYKDSPFDKGKQAYELLKQNIIHIN